MTSSWCQIILVSLLPLVESSLYDLRNNERIDAMDDTVAPDNGVGIHHSDESDLEPVSLRPELQKISRQGSEEARRRRPLFLRDPPGNDMNVDQSLQELQVPGLEKKPPEALFPAKNLHGSLVLVWGRRRLCQS